MASIQQSFNQMLQTGQFAASVYAHTPAGQAAYQKTMGAKGKKAEAKAKEKGNEGVAKAASEAQVKATSKAAALDPTYENLLTAQETSQYHEATYNPKKEETKETAAPASLRDVIGVKASTKEGRAIKSLFDRSKTLVDQKEEFMNRMATLGGIEYSMEDNYYGI